MASNSTSVDDYYRLSLAEVGRGLVQDGDSVLGQDTDELVAYFIEKYALAPLEIDLQGIEAEPFRKRDRVGSVFGEVVEREVDYLRITVPCAPHPRHPNLVSLRANTWRPYNEWNWHYLPSGAFELTVPVEEQRIKSEQEDLAWRVEHLNHDVTAQNAMFGTLVRVEIESRKKHLAERGAKVQKVVENLGIPLRRVTDGPRAVDLSRARTLHPERAKPIPRVKQEADVSLSPKQVEEIVQQVGGYVQVWERTPDTFAKLGEEELRNLIVSFLDQVFESATGETFSKRGKTDIYLEVGGRSVIIFECKWWSGGVAYGTAIDQLFGYLTWRQVHAVLLTFVRNQGMTQTVEAAKEATRVHSSVIGSATGGGDSYFRSRHRHPEDSERSLTLHHILVHLPAAGG